MTMPKGKYVGGIDPDNPKALGICDATGFIFKRKDLLRQMEWRGERLVWTGYYVGRPFLDTPNPQLIPPFLPPDPVPIVDPRIPQGTLITWETIHSPYWEQITDVTWDNWGTWQDGYPAISEPDRLENLEAGGSVDYGGANPGYYPPLEDALPEDTRLTLLQNYRWSA